MYVHVTNISACKGVGSLGVQRGDRPMSTFAALPPPPAPVGKKSAHLRLGLVHDGGVQMERAQSITCFAYHMYRMYSTPV